MRYLLGIPFVNRPDLLRRAVKSVRALLPHVVIVDNSDAGLDAGRWPVEILRPPASLSFTQTMNLLQRRALDTGCDVLLCMHNDAEAGEDTPLRLLALLDEAFAAGRRWGAAFTVYDALVAFNAVMIREVGAWDQALPQYFADNDYYRRVRLAGFEILDTGLPVTHHSDASSTVKSDPLLAHVNGVLFPLQHQYYAAKWGGEAHQERFQRPFDDAPSFAFVRYLREHELFSLLAATYETAEGTLLEHADPATMADQLQAIRHAVWLTRPRTVLETGTGKSLFGYVLGHLVPQATLYTFDSDPRCAVGVELLRRAVPALDVVFTLGDTRATLAALELPHLDLAWIDGGRDAETALSDTVHAMGLGARLIAVDDTRTMPEVACAVRTAMDGNPAYEAMFNPYWERDARGIAFIRRRAGADAQP
jgi:predicted O-methyltransferase YrrM